MLLTASFWTCLFANAQNDGHTYILNKQRQPLPYTNIVSLTTGKGTITDERGKFDHRQFASGDTLAITNIAYQRITIRTDQLKDTLYLVPKEKNLPNLDIYNWAAFNKKGTAGYSQRVKNHYYSFIPGGQWAIFIEGKTGLTRWIQTVHFKFQSIGKCNNLMRVRLASKSPENGAPGEDLIHETYAISIRDMNKNWIVNFKEQHVIIPEEGMYVVIEVLKADDTCLTNGYSDGIAGLFLHAAISDRPDACWRNFRDGRWYPLNGFGSEAIFVPQVTVEYKYR